MDVFGLTARIALDTSEYESGLGKAKKSASGFAETMKNVVKAVAGSAVVKELADITKASLDAYSSFEQLAGGAKKIFDAMDVSKIFLDADQAYKTLGMSANQYLAAINDVGASFSATMGDERGYETAKTGLQAISDFATGTGKSVDELSQKFMLITKSTASYQSIADQFSGILPATSAEFLNQAQAAGFLESSYKTLTEVPIADYQQAVAKMLEDGTAKLGLAGNTAEEAATTISGSAQMAKAAWENFLTAVADPTQDLDAKTDALVESLIAVGTNATPRVATAASRLISAFVNSTDAVRALVDAVELAGVVMTGQFAGKTIMSVIRGFQTAQVQIALFTAANGEAALVNAALNGTLTAGETIVGLLTGKISLATAAQAGWNAAMNANPIGIVIALVGTLAFAFGKAAQGAKKVAQELAGTATTSAEASEKMDELKAKMAELEKLQEAEWTRERSNEYLNLRNALGEVQGQYDALYAKEQEIAQSTALEEAAAAKSEQMQGLAQSFTDGLTALMDDYEQTYSSILGSVQGWFGPFEEASVKVKTSVDKMMEAMQSQIEFNQNYQQNLSTLAEMGLGSLASAFQELGPEGAAYAQTIVDAVEKAGGATSDGGKAIIENFKSLNANVVNSEAELSETMTTMSGKYDAAFADLVGTTIEGVAAMDLGADAKTAATSTLQGYLDGLNASKGGIFAVLDEIRQKAQSALSAINSVTGSGRSAGGYATGLDYVPYDNFPAYLHRGEAVLTAPEARIWRNGETSAGTSGGTTVVINQYIQSVPQTPAELAAATEAYFEQARWML